MRCEQKLYIMKNNFDLYKIGISDDPSRRVKEITNTSGVYTEIIEVYEVKDGKAKDVEHYLHSLFNSARQEGERFSEVDLYAIPIIVNTFNHFSNQGSKPKKLTRQHYRRGKYVIKRGNVYYLEENPKGCH